MILGRHSQHLHRKHLEREHEFRPIGEKQLDIRPREFYDNLRIFEIRMKMLARFDFESQLEARVAQDGFKKTFDPRPNGTDGVFTLHSLPLGGLFQRRLWGSY